MARDANGDLIANTDRNANPFAGYTGERPGYFYDPNWQEYFPISTHAGSYQNWDTGERSTEGAQPAYSEPSRQAEYQIEVRALPIVTAVDLAAVDLARTSIPGSIQPIASQPLAVPVTLSTAPAPIWREPVKPAEESKPAAVASWIAAILTTPSPPAPGASPAVVTGSNGGDAVNSQILVTPNTNNAAVAQPKRNWLGWGALLIGLYFVFGD